MTRRLALCERANDDAATRKIIEDLANDIDGAMQAVRGLFFRSPAVSR